ncbi:uncharacterized protein PSFLO_04248 [Pseudozyma flocculosa]|uniref:XPG N-terminal domain-containing protein n=1 Tax=Pseudozyma flocculosa TaxID=84751 RepID=A0A5C3F5R4_9BASI|nr:uncharacterized protein PSFLO_04248 [Pseudozyma flocculosa]
MGVQGLWQLLQPVARPIKLETLEGKRLAIDSSIWLYHFQMAMRDKEGRTLSNAHILGFLWRILKLLFHGIRPVFVFDGGAPVMKRRTLTNRKARKQGAKESHARTAEKLLAAQLRQAAIKHVAEGRSEPTDHGEAEAASGLDENTVYYDDLQQGRPSPLSRTALQGQASPSGSRATSSHDVSRNGSPEKSGSPSKPKKPDWHKDPYALPALERDLNTMSAQNGKKGKRADYRFATEGELRAVMSTIAPEDLDTESELFRSLPPELQYELVGDLRAQSRMTSYKRLQSMLATAPTPIDFSRAQIAGLKTRNDLTQKVLTVTDEIGSANIKVPLRVAGERNKEYVLVRNPGAEGGFVLGVRDSGATAEKAIDVDDDHEPLDTTDDERTHSDPELELEMDDVEIPAMEVSDRSADSIDPEVVALRSEADPVRRKEKALEILQMRAQQHARQARKEAGLEVDDLDARPHVARRAGEKPLFIRDFGSSRTDAIDLAAEDGEDDDDDDGNFHVEQAHHAASEGIDDPMSADEAEDLSRALDESERDQAAAPRQLYGFGLSSRGGEPISLHTAMRASAEHRSPSASSPSSLMTSARPVPRADVGTEAVPAGFEERSDDLDQDEAEGIEFEDVDVPTVPSAVQRDYTRAPPSAAAMTKSPSRATESTDVSANAPSSDAKMQAPQSGASSDRMKELAALVGRNTSGASLGTSQHRRARVWPGPCAHFGLPLSRRKVKSRSMRHKEPEEERSGAQPEGTPDQWTGRSASTTRSDAAADPLGIAAEIGKGS